MAARKSAVIYILSTGREEPVAYAAEELRKYLSAMSAVEVEIRSEDRLGQDVPGIRIGLFEPEGSSPPGMGGSGDRKDEIRIRVANGSGVILGSNPGSALIAVYRYLRELGCRWVRPGIEGEVVPRIDVLSESVEVSEAASYRFRGICIEGAIRLENIVDLIEWMPKVGFNGYFVQFREAHVFFERWYDHANNPLKQSDSKLTVETSLSFVQAIATELKRRGMEYHAVGHGWTCTAFGIPGLGWGKAAQAEEAEVTPYLAEVNGTRGLWKGVALDTELCYSNPEARRRMIGEIVQYASEHAEVDVLHVWLSDGHNNQCECSSCVGATPSDWYVLLLNELDAALTEKGLGIRIAFLLYQELLWAPLKERFRHSERFVMMFAPITRSYRHTFAEASVLPKMAPLTRNRIVFPLTVEENVAFLKQWQESFVGEAFDFDYHFMWAHQRDPGQTTIAKILHEDIRHLRRLGLDGYFSCQVQRAFFPNGLGLTVMGMTLWDETTDYERLIEEYFISAYGPDGLNCRNYLTILSERYEQIGLERWAERDRKDPTALKAAFAEIRELLVRFGPVIEKNLSAEQACHSVSWRYLSKHREIWLEMTRILQLFYEQKLDEARENWAAFKLKLWEMEDEVQPVLDVHNFVIVFDWIILDTAS